MTSNRQALNDVIFRLKEPHYFHEYLAQLGKNIHKPFRCPNPEHPDNTPSAGVIRQSNRGYCFGCSSSFDLFDLAVWVEGRPSSGPGWVTETVKYLADRFSIPFETPQLTAEELREMEVISAYSHAYQIIRHFKDGQLSPAVQEKVQQLRWDQKFRYRMGIGSVLSYKDFLDRMIGHYKHSLDLLKSCDLADDLNGEVKHYNASRIFNENALIFAIRDIDGRPVGFSARNLRYEQEKAAHEAGELNRIPKKYAHTREEGTLFRKSSLLYNLDQAKKSSGPIEVVEGNPDVNSLVSGGYEGVVGTLGVAFTREHLELLLTSGKKHIIVGLDNDKAGKDGVGRIVKLVEEVGGHVGMRLEVRVSPTGVKDPDQYVRSFPTNQQGAEAWRALPKDDLFTWSIKKRLEAGEDPLTISETTIALIVNEPSNIRRDAQIRKLAELTNTSAALAERELLRLLDKENSRLDEERALIADNLAKMIRQNPQRAESATAMAMHQYEALNKRRIGHSREAVLEEVRQLRDESDNAEAQFELCTGFPIFDRTLEGVPRTGTFIMIPGKPHHGKSVWMDNMIIGLLNNNPDIHLILHTVDDVVKDRRMRLLGAYSGLKSKFFRNAGFYKKTLEGQRVISDYGLTLPEFLRRHDEANDWVETMISADRFTIVDTNRVPARLESFRAYLSDLKQQVGRPTLLFGDNFHLYSLNTDAKGEEKVSAMSSYIKNEIVPTEKVSAIFTVEIPKGALAPGLKPSYLDLKGSGSLSFDAKACTGVYNQLQDWVGRPEMQDIWWESPEIMRTVTRGDGSQCRENVKLPVVELIVDKNKINGETDSIFYKMESKSGRMAEASEIEQEQYRQRLFEAELERKDRSKVTQMELRNSKATYRRAV